MVNFSVRIIDSLKSLRRHGEAWNDLWLRSEVYTPTCRQEIISLWMEQFAADKSFRSIVVETEEKGKCRFVAALPLYIERKIKCLRVGMLPSNDWSYCGDLLIDPQYDIETVLPLLIENLKTLPIDLLWLDPIRFELPRWKSFLEQLKKTKSKSQILLRYRTAVASVHGDRETLAASWRKSGIKDIRRRLQKYYPPDSYRFEMIEQPEKIAALLPDCFELENAGWKGKNGGSILENGLEKFYVRQAQLLADKGLFRLCVLYFEDKLAAFRYCYYAKRAFCSMKVSYDPALRTQSPGQVLQWLSTNVLIDDPEIDRLDFMGIALPHQNVWNPELQVVGQCVLPVSGLGKTFFFFYDRIMPWVRKRREIKAKKQSELEI